MGDYENLTRIFQTAPDDFIERLCAEPLGHALDIACGTGFTALPLARLGFEVTGLDLSPRMLDIARGKSHSHSLAVRFDEGVVEAMPYADASFDVAVSMFGIMFSPMPQVAMMEVARVLKPGGRLAMASWKRGSFSMRMGGVFASCMSSGPANGAPPLDWAEAEQVRRIVGSAFPLYRDRHHSHHLEL